ncbi:hypothetical protein SALB1_0202 [Salinisphaera sp. LB1]|nr:hypothetical protein SALB1_0202 [Salinisphaera sp. LB1]
MAGIASRATAGLAVVAAADHSLAELQSNLQSASCLLSM